MNWYYRISHYFWPVLSGLLIAIVISVVAPEWLAKDSTPQLSEDYQQTNSDWSGPVSYAEAARRAAPSVVNIYARKIVRTNSNPLMDDPFFRRVFNGSNTNQTREQQDLGSGVIVSTDGYVLTNAHVIDGADEIILMLYDGRQAVAEVVGVDAETDLAVLHIELDNLKAINMGDPKSAQVGDITLAIGNPFGFGQTVTQGIISATGRNLVDFSLLVNFLQTDAAINAGNSGGALVDAYGNLLGINTRKFESTGSVGLGFAIPADVAVEVLMDIVENGEVVRGWLGIGALQLTDELSDSLELRRGKAMIVTGLYPGGPGHRAGIEVGDVIIGINDQDIIDGRRVMALIAGSAPGEKLTFKILRDGKPLSVIAEVDHRPELTFN